MPNQPVCDKPAVEPGPSLPARKMTAEELERLRERRAARPPLAGDAIEIIRAMRERTAASRVLS
jgi:hypothetical protein